MRFDGDIFVAGTASLYLLVGVWKWLQNIAIYVIPVLCFLEISRKREYISRLLVLLTATASVHVRNNRVGEGVCITIPNDDMSAAKPSRIFASAGAVHCTTRLLLTVAEAFCCDSRVVRATMLRGSRDEETERSDRVHSGL